MSAYYTAANTVRCPDCGKRADRDFGDHGGQCLDHAHVVTPATALGIIRRHALHHQRFSAEDLRREFDAAGIKRTSRGPAFGAAKKRRWIEQDGYELSTDAATKRAAVQTYTSLIYQPATDRRAS